jgi:hypothetical protein
MDFDIHPSAQELGSPTKDGSPTDHDGNAFLLQTA